MDIIAAKDVIYLDQNSKWLCKKPEFLSAAYYYYKKISVRHKWNNAEILLAYRGQSKVEYVFRNLKNPYHMAIRPQYHWTDQKIEAHFLICIIGYLLTVYIYRKTKHCYFRNISHLMDALRDIRLACITERKNKISYQLEEVSPSMREVAKKLNISNETIRPKINFSDYI